MMSYYAGAKVSIIDEFGLTDAFVARCPPSPDSRVGHIEHGIPPAYLEARQVIECVPHWEARLQQGDAGLVTEANARPARAAWDAQTFILWQRVQRITHGPLWSAQRWRTIPAYVFH